MHNELLQQLFNNHLISGAAGGGIRAISQKERISRILLSMFIGTVSAFYLTPLLVLVALHYIDEPQKTLEIQLAAGPFIGFVVGIGSIGLANIVEQLISKVLKL